MNEHECFMALREETFIIVVTNVSETQFSNRLLFLQYSDFVVSTNGRLMKCRYDVKTLPTRASSFLNLLRM